MVLMRSRTSLKLSPEIKATLLQLGLKVRRVRLDRSIQQKEMAARIGVVINTYAKVERGDPGVAMGVYMLALHDCGLSLPIPDFRTEEEAGTSIVKRRVRKSHRLTSD
jgi:transcriptional regulator with XRE-family HTH domain